MVDPIQCTKTEVMLISNEFSDTSIDLIMDGTILHKHLGVQLSSNNKWSKNIDSIIASASKQISFLRKIKYKFSKQTLNTLHCTYIRPLFEYVSEVWDGCTQSDANRLEQVQYCYRFTSFFASLNSLYHETGWETLSHRRTNKKLSLLYKIINNDVPGYLTNLLPGRVGEQTHHNLRNNQKFEIPYSRL